MKELTMHPIVEVVTSTPVGDGVTAHRRGGILYGHFKYGGFVIAYEAPYAACKPISEPTEAVPLYSYSAGWARSRGAAPCPDPRCFGGGS